MRKSARYVIRTLLAASLLIVLLGGASAAHADAISFQLSATSLTTTSGGTVTFTGTIKNNSGGDLNASEFFFNFFGFDPTSVSPIQDLGVTTDFLIRNGIPSNTMALFHVRLGSVAAGSSFPFQVQLEDINSDLSATQTVTVSVPGVGKTPEPTGLLLLAVGLVPIILYRPKHKVS